MKPSNWSWLGKTLGGLATLTAIVGVSIAYLEYQDRVERERKAEELQGLGVIESVLEALGFSDQNGMPILSFSRDKDNDRYSIPETDLREARRAIQEYAILQPQDEEGIAELWAFYYLMAGDFEKIEKLTRERMALDSEVSDADLNVVLGKILATRFNLPEQADLLFEQAIQDENANAQHLFFYARFLHSEGHHDLNGPKHVKAINLLRKAISENRHAIEPRHALGHILSETAKPREAINVLKEMLKGAPWYAPGHNTLGGVQWQDGKYLAARASFEKAVAIEPTNAVYIYNLSLALRSLGQISVADQKLRQAADLWKLEFSIKSQRGEPLVFF